MAKFPEPPDIENLMSIAPVTTTLKAGTRVYRIFRSSGGHPVHWHTFRHFGPTPARFDHQLPDHQGQPWAGERGILYGAVGPDAIPTCLAEVYQTSRTINRHDRNPVLCAFSLSKPLTLLDLTGPFPTQIGASMAINSGPRGRARRWAQKLYEAYPGAHGIRYSSSMYGNQPAIALFERSAFAIPDYPDFHRQLNDPVLTRIIQKTAMKITYSIVDL